MDGREAPGINIMKNNYLTSTMAGRHSRQFCCIYGRYHLASEHLTVNTCGSFDEIQMSPVIIDPVSVFLWELCFDICEFSAAVSQGDLYLDMGYKYCRCTVKSICEATISEFGNLLVFF